MNQEQREAAQRIYFIHKIREAGSDNLSLFGGKFEGGLHIQQKPTELAELLIFLANRFDLPEPYLEIGAAAGGTAWFIQRYILPRDIYIIDSNQHSKCCYRTINIPDAIEFIGDSHSEECRKQLTLWNEKFDIVLIDGDHSYRGVRQDTELVLPWLKSGSVVVYHDSVAVRDVAKLVDEIAKGVLYKGRFRLVKEIADSTKPLGLTIFEYLHGPE